MASASFCDVFLRLPPPAAFLFLSAILGTTDGHVFPRQTKTVELHELNVVAWPPLPTDAPISPRELFRRQLDNTICGYVGGDESSPATCAPGAHCVLDTSHGYVGCCRNDGPCSEGVYTGCVDGNSGPQTEVNPYVFTCGGSNVCYQNEYPGGYHQYGCGTASDLGTTVETSILGPTSPLDLPQVSVSLTEAPVSLSEPTTFGSMTGTRSRTVPESSKTDTGSRTSAIVSSTDSMTPSTTPSTRSLTFTTSSTDSTTSSRRPSSTTTSSIATSTDTATSSSTTGLLPTEAPATSEDEDDSPGAGAIIGGVLGGLAGITVIIALIFFCLRRQRLNEREGPGPTPTAPPTTENMSPARSHGAAFAPLPSWQDNQSNNGVDDYYYGNPYGNPYGEQLYPDQAYPTATNNGNEAGFGNGNYAAPYVSPPQGYDSAHVASIGTGLAPVEEEARSESPTRDIDRFSQAYTDARIGQTPSDESIRPLTEPEPVSSESTTSSSYPSPVRSGGGRPLWQQNRQRSRNLMWM